MRVRVVREREREGDVAQRQSDEDGPGGSLRQDDPESPDCERYERQPLLRLGKAEEEGDHVPPLAPEARVDQELWCDALRIGARPDEIAEVGAVDVVPDRGSGCDQREERQPTAPS